MYHPPHFADRCSAEQGEEGFELAPKFDVDGLLPCITADAASGEALATSGLVQIRIDDDQHALWLRVRVQAGPGRTVIARAATSAISAVSTGVSSPAAASCASLKQPRLSSPASSIAKHRTQRWCDDSS